MNREMVTRRWKAILKSIFENGGIGRTILLVIS